jgi:dTDP-4-dehydrorhamnose reductase
MKKRIVITGGAGRFGNELKKVKTNYKLFFPTKKKLDILKINTVRNFLKKTRPNFVIHLAGLSRPMKEHEKNIKKSISLNIVGTANLVNVCSEMKIKLIYLSTSYIYMGTKGGYKETDPLLPWNNYGWSKLGGECSVHMYKNSLIIRASITQRPFVHKKAFGNVKINFMYQDEAAKIIFKLINKKGVINLGGKAQTIFNFAKKNNPKVKKISARNKLFPNNLTMNLSKLKKII